MTPTRWVTFMFERGNARTDEAVLWVVPENQRARGLYGSEGWVADGGSSTEEILGVTVNDIRYRKSLTVSPHV